MGSKRILTGEERAAGKESPFREEGPFRKESLSREEKSAGEERSARECALFLLEYAGRTEQEMRQKLAEREYPPDEIEEAVAFLLEYHYLDDEAYARSYISSRSLRKSSRRIRAELEQKGVARDVIEEGLRENPVDEEAQIRAFLTKKGYCTETRSDPGQYRRIVAALSRRGYSYDAIRRMMGRMEEEWI